MGYLSGNCLIAQSGGPTSVINASAYGCIREFLSRQSGCTVFAGLYGIEGILKRKIIDVGKIPASELEKLRYMPSAAFGSNRYRLKDYRSDDTEYVKLFGIFKEFDIRYFFYIGGNDSMDTANKLSEYARLTGYGICVCGIPKTIDNDLVLTDHCPGFGSAAKYVVNAGMEMWLDINTYNKTSVMVTEVMGRDTGWIAASAGVLRNAVPDMNLLVYCPEKAFDYETFLSEANAALKKKDKLLIVASEGLKDADGNYVNVAENGYQQDCYGHRQLGGVGKSLQHCIRKNVTDSVKLAELGILQRCSMHCVSEVDRMEAEKVGRDSVRYALEGNSGFMTALRRKQAGPYECATEMVRLTDVCNRIRYVPQEWLEGNTGKTDPRLLRYMEPLVFDQKPSYCFFDMTSRMNPVAFRKG